MSTDMTAAKWLHLTYNLAIGDTITTGYNKGSIIVDILPTDNIGHYRTTYPIVLHVYTEKDEHTKITIESLTQ